MPDLRYSRVRGDFWAHETTSWMHAIHRDLVLLVGAMNHLGVCDKSLLWLSGMTREDPEDLLIAMRELTEKGTFKYYQKYDCYWCVESADNNLDGRSWQSATRQLAFLPPELQDDIWLRYGDKLGKFPEQLPSRLRVSVSVSVRVNSDHEARSKQLDFVKIAQHLSEARTKVLGKKSKIDPNGAGFRANVQKPTGATTEAWLQVIDRQAHSLAKRPHDAAAWLTTSTMSRPANWQRLMESDHLDPPTESEQNEQTW